MMAGRPILARQANFAFYRPSALILGQLLADLPFGLPRTTLFIIIPYFMAGLHRSAGAFFILWIAVNISYYSFRALFSLFGALTENYFFAARLGSIILSILVLWAGYVLPQVSPLRSDWMRCERC
jgi:ATP-binding cassette, subfamily G (WHITE), member 2, SNQ2